MPFELIPKKAPKSSVEADKVYLRSRTMNLKKLRGGAPRKYYSFAIGPAVLKNVGWDDATLLSILWGTGADLGKVQIAPDEEGAWSLRFDKVGAGYLSTGQALPPTCAGADFPNKAVAFETKPVGAAAKPKLIQLDLPANFHTKGK